MTKQERQIQYTQKILLQIKEMFNDDCENFIDINEFSDGEKLTDFFHCLANCVPNMLYHQFTGNDTSNLEFNHICNQLVFQNSQLEK